MMKPDPSIGGRIEKGASQQRLTPRFSPAWEKGVSVQHALCQWVVY